MEQKVQDQLEVLKKIEKSIDLCQKRVNELIKTDKFQEKIEKNVEAKERAELNWALSYGVYTSYYLYLLLNERDPKTHEISGELRRLQDYKEKINKAVKERENPPTEKEVKNNKRNKEIKKVQEKLLGNKRKKKL